MKDAVNVLHVAVNYETTEQCDQFVRRYLRTRSLPDRTQLVVVDNSSADRRSDLARLASAWGPDVALLLAPSNLGYLGGARYALESPRCAKALARVDWLIVSNVDLSYDHGQLERALAAHDPSAVAAIAPRIVSAADRSELNPFMATRPSPLRMRSYQLLFRSFAVLVGYSWVSEAIRRATRALRSTARVSPGGIYAPHGSFFILSRRCFGSAAALAHRPFLFGEEIFVAERARNAGLPIVFDPSIRIEHADHASTRHLPKRSLHRFHRDAADWIARTYFSSRS